MVTLVTVGQATLAAAAAASYARCLWAGAPDSVTSSYRDPMTQQRWRDEYLRGERDAYVAPVERSDHVKGLAIDLRGPEAKAWFRAWGESFGWVFTDPTEDWHIAYREDRDQHRTDPPPSTAGATEEDDMPLTDDDVERIAQRAAALVWGYQMTGGAELPDGKKVPTETAGERLRQVRRSTHTGYVKTSTILKEVKK